MRQLIIGVILAVCLVGCGEKPEFSINEKDTLEFYVNNPIFTKVEQHIDPASEDNKNTVVYQFKVAPASVYDNIKTSDLDVLGGYIAVNSDKASKKRGLILTIKGKASFDKLLDRLNQRDYQKDMTCMKMVIDKDYQFMCNNFETKRMISINYNHFTDSSYFFIHQR